MRVHVETDARTGKTTQVPFTAEEEAAQDLAEANVIPPRDLLAEVSALQIDVLEAKKASAALIAKGVITKQDIEAQKVDLVAEIQP